MKRLKLCLCMLLALGVLLALPGLNGTRAAGYITMDRIIQISDYEVVAEFSDAVAFFVNTTKTPWVCIRMVSDGDSVAYDGEGESRAALQWAVSLEFTDESRDRLLCTLRTFDFGVQTIDDILNFNGQLAKYRGVYVPKFCIEEIPNTTRDHRSNGLVDNITSPDGKTGLLATRPKGYDGAYCNIDTDYTYEIDRSTCFGVLDTAAGATVSLEVGQAPLTGKESQPAAKINPLTAGLILGGAVVSAVLILLIVARFSRKKEAKTP